MRIEQSPPDVGGVPAVGRGAAPIVDPPGAPRVPDVPPVQSAPPLPPALAPGPPPLKTGPLGESDFLAIRQAAVGHKIIRGVARTAHTSAVVTLVIGISALPVVAFWPSWDGALVAVGLCVVGAVEYWGSRRIRRAEPSAAGILGKNQLAFLGLIIFYCVVQMVTFSPEQAKAAALSPEVRSQLGGLGGMEKAIDSEIDRWAPLITYGFYGLVIVLSVLCQGGLALYYFSRRKRIETFNSQTPPWVRLVFTELSV